MAKVPLKAKTLFCRHDYAQTGFRQEEQDGVRFSVRLYECQICGKSKWLDGRQKSGGFRRKSSKS